MIGETDRGQGARRGWDDDTSMVLSTAVTSPEAEEHGAKMKPRFPTTGSGPTSPPAPSRPTLQCLGHKARHTKKDKKKWRKPLLK